jgi:PAS domain S-box-containing protein
MDLDYGQIMSVSLMPFDGEGSPRPPGADVVLELERLQRQRADDLAALAAAHVRRRCLAELGERLRGCETAAQISLGAAEILGCSLGCSRTGYAIVDGDSTEVEADWTDGALESLSGRHKFASLGDTYVERIERGEVVVVPDVETHPLTAGNCDWAAIGVQSLLNVPLLDNGRLAAMVYAHQSRRRCWTADEVSLVQEVADRTWEAMSRARAVEALRRVNDTLEAQVRDRTLQRDRMWMLSTDLMMVTSRDGVILSVNPAWTRLLGWREEELVGASFYTFVHPDDRDRTRIGRLVVEQGGVIEKLENRYLTRDGRTVWLSWKAVPDGDLVHSVARDITAEREQADALRAAEEALRHAQKMEAVGQLTGGIAHDFNNLLTGIMGSLELIQGRLQQGRLSGLDAYAAAAQGAARRAAALTHRLLAFSRRQTLDPKPTDVNRLVAGMEDLLRRSVGPSVAIEVVHAVGLWGTLVDPPQLESALLNLCINARDAMPGGGRLTIETANTWIDDREGARRDLAPGQYVALSVTDTGTGMSPEVAKRAFDPFFTTKPIGQGTGLGLSMIYGFARQSGGDVRIHTEPGQGTTVRIHLPRHHTAEVPPEAPPDRTVPPRCVQGRTVLVVDDEPTVRTLVTEVLHDVGCAAIEANDGPEGLRILRSGARIDLLITDVGLPGGMNGRQVADAARLIRPGLQVLFITGYAENAAIGNGHLEPGMQVLIKPFSMEDLGRRLHQLL